MIAPTPRQTPQFDQLPLLRRALAVAGPVERLAIAAKIERITAQRMTSLLAGRRRGLVAPIPQPEGR